MELSTKQTQEMLAYVAEHMISIKDILTKADQAIGDGDHGIGMARGFEAVQEKLASQEFETLDALFQAVGMALISNIGGASGAIFGTLFRAGGKALAGQQSLTAHSLSQFLRAGFDGVTQRGKASVGDKTMVDALEPACLESERPHDDLITALTATAEAAEAGMENTKKLVATLGRAKTLGERALGHADPGAVSMAHILRSMADYASAQSTQT